MPVRKKKGRASSDVDDAKAPSDVETLGPTVKRRKEGAAESEDIEEHPKILKKTKATVEKSVFPRSETPRSLEVANDKQFTAISWNVGGLRPTLEKRAHLLKLIISTECPDVLCLQETKLQEKDLDWATQQLDDVAPGYTASWNCSEDKKGYSGLVVLVKGGAAMRSAPSTKKQKSIAGFFKAGRDKTDGVGSRPKEDSGCSAADKSSTALPINISKGMGKKKHDGEGRIMTLEYDAFFLLFAYTPNSGDKLQRLSYRIEEWDTDLWDHLKELEKSKPVILAGDLNVAHLDADIWNVEAKHIAKSAGTTPQERGSFSALLEKGYKDTFRHFHPEARGCFTFWSVRAQNRPWNRGLRLDYFVASNNLFADSIDGKNIPSPSMKDAWIMDEVAAPQGDHCPVGITLNL